MSKLGGCREWDSAQARACQCVDEDNAVKRRTKSLEDIYKKVNKDKLSDVPALAKKHGTSASKFSKLVVKLIRKYPRLITVKRSVEFAPPFPLGRTLGVLSARTLFASIIYDLPAPVHFPHPKRSGSRELGVSLSPDTALTRRAQLPQPRILVTPAADRKNRI
jgi:hypothetical protein